MNGAGKRWAISLDGRLAACVPAARRTSTLSSPSTTRCRPSCPGGAPRGERCADPGRRRAARPLGARHDRCPRARLGDDRSVRRGRLGAGRARRAAGTATTSPRRSSISPASRSETEPPRPARPLPRRRRRASTRSTRRSSGCARRLGLEPPRWRGARFAVALTHDVDVPWRWTRLGVRGAAARLQGHVARRSGGRGATRGARSRRGSAPQAAPHGSELALRADLRHRGRARRGARPSSSWPATTIRPTAPRRRPTSGCGRASSRRSSRAGPRSGCTAATRRPRTPSGSPRRRGASRTLAGPLAGQRYHYLRVDPHGEPRAARRRSASATTRALGFADAPGLPGRDRAAVPAVGPRAPTRPLDARRDPARRHGRDARRGALPRACPPRPRSAALLALVDWAAEQRRRLLRPLAHRPLRSGDRRAAGIGSTFASSRPFAQRGGVCLSAGELAEEADAWLR